MSSDTYTERVNPSIAPLLQLNAFTKRISKQASQDNAQRDCSIVEEANVHADVELIKLLNIRRMFLHDCHFTMTRNYNCLSQWPARMFVVVAQYEIFVQSKKIRYLLLHSVLLF